MDELAGPLEAIMAIASEPVSEADLASALEVPLASVRESLVQLQQEYEGGQSRPRGYRLRNVGGGWRLYSAPEYAPIVGKFVTRGRRARLSRASLETLAVIAYRQPCTRTQVAQIRGVAVDSVVRTLLSHEMIEEAGEAPSGAVLYRTTEHFLEQMGMNSLDELPPLSPFMPQSEDLDNMLAAMEDHDE
ncbi:SMC-Scp complex subunit ScpB [Winkia neuii]|uniref:Segregation and condensation protein B n=1 Tax=Winkia neuii BV029A5 TaxID=888439 RepID=K0YWG1_9ACTO|nr:SMC-Scp complex subunit ScpB [Winkia neuii]EJZ88001.1 segregation and condensation protein B [Winkia neuii BV029A5]